MLPIPFIGSVVIKYKECLTIKYPLTAMIDYVKYREYLNELLRMYRENKSLAGMGKVAKRYGVTALTKEFFFEKGFHTRDNEFTPAEVKVIRDEVSKVRSLKGASRYIGGNVSKSDGVSPTDMRFADVKLPDGFELVQICEDGDYRYALKCDSAIDNASCCMCYINAFRSKKERDLCDELSRVLKDRVIELYAGRVPLPCVDGDMDYAPLYMAKCSNDGTCYFLASSACILVGLAWICSDLEKENKPK